MNVFSIIALVITAGLMWYFYFRTRLLFTNSPLQHEYPFLVWVSRGVLLVTILLTLWIVHKLIVPIPNPFDGPKATNLPKAPPKASSWEEEEKPKTVAPAPMDEAERQHRERLKRFEGKEEVETPTPAETTH